jgi:hypothetical protein
MFNNTIMHVKISKIRIVRGFIFFSLLMIAVSCQDESMNNSCNPFKIIRSVKDMSGKITYNEILGTFVVKHVPEFTYDTQIIGIPCNIEEKFISEGLEVTFSGTYFQYDKEISAFSGQEFYYLGLSEIKLILDDK